MSGAHGGYGHWTIENRKKCRHIFQNVIDIVIDIVQILTEWR
jgi:hypothetical protein